MIACMLCFTNTAFAGEVQEHITVSECTSDQVSYLKYTAGKTDDVVFVLHGLGDNKTVRDELARQLARGGFDVIKPDAYSHGASPGNGSVIIENVIKGREMIDSIIEREQYQDKNIYLFGWSMGGMTEFYYAANGKYPIKGIVSLISTPDFESVKGIPLFYEKYRDKEYLGTEDQDTVDLLMKESNPLTVLLQKQICIPMYWLSGMTDAYMPIGAIQKAAVRLGVERYIEREKTGHTVTDEEFTEAADWLIDLAKRNHSFARNRYLQK